MNAEKEFSMRLDLVPIRQWIDEETRVLDLGCGDGKLLQYLSKVKRVNGLGVEIDTDNITACIAKGLNVIEQDIDLGLANFSDNSFDTVLLTQTLQAVHRPDFVLSEMLRVGKECIITFPNFGHWRARWDLMVRGKMPVSKFMPYHWYDTPNIHFCTVKDFEVLCIQQKVKVINRVFQADKADGKRRTLLPSHLPPNLYAAHAIYHVTR